jgi:hypothetical protein
MMQHIDAAAMARGYAEILCADGGKSLLRLHALTRPAEERLYYAVADGDEVVFVSDESEAASACFNRETHGRERPDAAAESTREDFLLKNPTRLPTVRGEAWQRIAGQVTRLAQAERPAEDQQRQRDH